MPREDIDRVLHELAQTAAYMQQSGVLMRESVQHLIETEQHFIATQQHLIKTERRIEQVNAFLQRSVEHITHAIDAALRANDDHP